MIPAAKRKTPYRPRRKKKSYKSRPSERVKGDRNFRNDWGFSQDTAKVAHFFMPSVSGMLVSLCHVVIQAPVWIAPSTSDTDRRCGICARLVERRQKLAKLKRERDLKRHLDARVATFMADPALGPRLYGCPVCNSVYEGMAPSLFPCSDGGHPPVLVVELARKDTWTRDKTP